MFFDFAGLAHQDTYKLLASTVVPRPIAWIVTQSPSGLANLSAFSYFNILTNDPAVVGVGISTGEGDRVKDTLRNIRATHEFTICLVPEALGRQMNITATDFPPEVDEMVVAGLERAPSRLVAPPRVAASPVALECRTHQLVPVGERWTIVLGRVLAMHVQDDCVLDAGRFHIDTPGLGLIGRMHGRGWYARSGDLFEMPRMSPGDFPDLGQAR